MSRTAAKNVKRKKTSKRNKRSNALLTFSVIIFMFSGLCYLGSSLFLRSYNNSLSTQKQDVLREITALQTQNDTMSKDIDVLQTSNRVYEEAGTVGLSLNLDNVITITAETPDSGD